MLEGGILGSSSRKASGKHRYVDMLGPEMGYSSFVRREHEKRTKFGTDPKPHLFRTSGGRCQCNN